MSNTFIKEGLIYQAHGASPSAAAVSPSLVSFLHGSIRSSGGAADDGCRPRFFALAPLRSRSLVVFMEQTLVGLLRGACES